jgi:aspartate racemase
MSRYTKGMLGLGVYSTMHYYQRINEFTKLKTGKEDNVEFLILNTNFRLINQYLPDKFEQIRKYLLPYLDKINELGIELLIVPNITIHQHLDRILKEKRDYNYKLSHPILATIECLNKKGINAIYVLGTMFTMNNVYIKQVFNDHNIETLDVPNKVQEKVDELRKQVYLGKNNYDQWH